VEEGERRLAAQEARVANLDRKGRDLPHSKKLLTIMRETMALQISHLKLLQREVRSEQDDQAMMATVRPRIPPLGSGSAVTIRRSGLDRPELLMGQDRYIDSFTLGLLAFFLAPLLDRPSRAIGSPARDRSFALRGQPPAASYARNQRPFSGRVWLV